MDDSAISKEELVNKLKGLFELLDTIPDAVFEIDALGNIIYLNKAGLQKLGISSDDLSKGIKLLDCIEGNLKIDHDIKTPHEAECVLVSKGGLSFPAILLLVPVIENDKPVRYRVTARDISPLKQAEREKKDLLTRLEETRANVKTLRGLLPICAHCKKIRDESGKWHSLEDYIRDHTEAEFSHSLCPDCIASLYPDLFEEQSELGFSE
jgi:PAS domain S-box-containing protein